MKVFREDAKCDECGSIGVSDGKEIVCPECDTVIRDCILDRKPTFKGYEPGVSQDNVLNPPSSDIEPLKGIGTMIGDGQYRGKDDDVFKLLWSNKRTREEFCPRGLRTGLHDLKKICSSLDLPRYVVEEVGRQYRNLYLGEGTGGRSKSSVFVGIILAVCRQYDMVRTPQEIGEAVGMPESSDITLRVLSHYKKISDLLELNYQPFTAKDYCKRLCSQLKVNGDDRQQVTGIIDRLEGKKGYNPRCVASAAMYLVVKKKDLDITQKDIGECMDITSTSIRNRYQEFAEELGIEFDD